MIEFEGRVAVVSGGASGIGAACIEQFRAAGATAIAWDISGDYDVYCDTSSEESVQKALAETIERFGVPTLHVASAGVRGYPAPMVDIPVDVWDATYGVNVRGVFLTVRTIAKRMIDEGLDGSMVTVSSVQGKIPDPVLSLYSSTKAAVYQMTRVAAIELGPYGIRVNAIGPGPTVTAMTAGLASSEEWVRQVEEVTPLRQVGTPGLVAEAALNIMRSEWLTGQCVLTDGGSSLISARGATRAKLHNVEIAEKVARQ